MSGEEILNFSPHLCRPHDTIRQCMLQMEQLGQGETAGRRYNFLVVCDGDNRVIGTVTDGDIRRGLLQGHTLDRSIREIAKACPTLGQKGKALENELLLRSLASYSKFLPVVDEQNRICSIVLGGAEQSPEVSALIMAGGFGRRLGQRTASIPKPLLEVRNRPILDHIIERIYKVNPKRIYVSAHFLAEKIEQFVAQRPDCERISVVREHSPLGTAGCIGIINPTLDCPLIVANGDVITGMDFSMFSQFFFKQKVDALVAVARHKISVPYGVVKSAPDGSLLRIDEKPVFEHFVVAGIYMLAPIFHSLVEKGEAIDMPALIQRGQERGLRVALFPLHEDWTDIGRPEDLARAEIGGTPEQSTP